MKQFTIADIREFKPCYDPSKYLEENWSGNVLNILDNKDIPFQDRLWVILRNDFLDDKLMRLFAVFCARQVQHLMTDERSVKAIDIAEQFANGLATREELSAARVAAGAAAGDAASYAAWAAACNAAEVAAGVAARDAARYASDAARYAQEIKLRELILLSKGLL